MALLVAVVGFSSINPVAANAAVTMAKSADEKIPSIFTPEEFKRYKLLSDSDKDEIRKVIQGRFAQEYCGNFAIYTTLGKGSGCEKFLAESLKKMSPTADQALGVKTAEMTLCQALKENGASSAAVKVCEVNRWVSIMKILSPLTKEALKLTPFGGLIFGYEIVKFIADPKTPLDNLANQAKAESIEGTQKVLEQITSASTFDPDDEGFRELWSIYAGVGVMLLALMTILLYKSYSDGHISEDNFMKTVMYWLPASALLVFYGPALMSTFNGWSNGLEKGTSSFAAEKISSFIQVISRFAALEQTGYFGPIMALIFFGIMLIGAWGILLYLLLVPAFQYLLGASIAVLIALFIHPKTRPAAIKSASLVLLLTFLKPLLLLVLGGAFQWAGSRPVFAKGYEDDTFATIANVAVIAVFMIIIALSPVALLKFMPVINADDADMGGSPGFAGGAAGAGASAVTQSIRQSRSRGNSGSSNGNSGESRRVGSPAPSNASSSRETNQGSSTGSSQGKQPSVAAASSTPSASSSTGRSGAAAAAAAIPLKAGTSGVLAAARDTARRSRESVGSAVPSSWNNNTNNDAWRDDR
ncbi:UNVERIFIED_CONTAM: hypothetical protein Q9R71_35495 [Actinomycetes bacterium ARC8]|nr:hypothetical protein [Actinomycetes bacterium ARC8]